MIFKYDEELPIVVTLLVTYALCCAVLALVFQVGDPRNPSGTVRARHGLHCPLRRLGAMS